MNFKDLKEETISYTNQTYQTKMLIYKCPDFQTWLEGDDPQYQCCHYCINLTEPKKLVHCADWLCKHPIRQAQRQHYANLDTKQKVLAP